MLKTEMRNEKTTHIDKMDTLSMLKIINEENMNSVNAVGKELDSIAAVIDAAAERFSNGGRIFYIGAGTSGRLAVADAAECPPTFGIDCGRVVGIIAGGEKCFARAGESGEDSGEDGVKDIARYGITEKDTVIGISVAGGANYVVAAVNYANEKGALTAGITSNAESRLASVAKLSICPDTGPEVITGSTRMKGGNSQKFVLNMISTCVMVKCGYVYENLMINLKPSNIKLKNRMISIVGDILSCDAETAERLLGENGWDIKKTVYGKNVAE